MINEDPDTWATVASAFKMPRLDGVVEATGPDSAVIAL
jgi:hypothetical protein